MSLDQKTNVKPAADSTYEDFIPPSDWDHDKESDTLILMLPGFRKEQLRVQVTPNRVLRVSGERKISDNKHRRFHKELSISEGNETSGIGAKFEAGMLYVRIPKVIKPPPQTQTQEEPPKLHQPTTTTTDHKPNDDQPPESKVERKATEPQTPLQETKAKEEDSQKEPQKEKSKSETDINNKTSEAHETHDGTAQTLPSQELESDKDSQKKSEKESGKVETDANKAASEKAEAAGEKAEALTSKDHGTSHDRLGKRIMDKWSVTMDMLSGLVVEVKKQHKLANVVTLIVLVLLIGLYIKNVFKSAFGGPKSHEL